MNFLQSLGIVTLLNDISSGLAWKEVMVSSPNFRISPANPSGPTVFFLPIFNEIFLII